MSSPIRSNIGKLAFLMAGILIAHHAQAQTAPAFEVVSIKLEKPGQGRGLSMQYLPGGRFVARGAPIPFLVVEAYDTISLNPAPSFAN
jgi:hypothetical protein